MFKDYDKYLSTSLKVYILVLVIVFIMKIVGLDYFQIDLNNEIINKINNNVFSNKIILSLFNMIFIMFYQYVMLCLVCKSNSKKMFIINIIEFPIALSIQLIKSLFLGSSVTLFIDLFYLYILFLVINNYTQKIRFKEFNKRFLIVISLNFLFQFLSSVLRYKYLMTCINNQVADMILNLDYVLMMLITYKLYFQKGEIICTYQVEVSSFLQKLTNLKRLPKRLQRNWRKFKQLQKVDKITFIIYFALYLLWNIFTVVVVLLVATLNDTFIECIFILTSFWLSKREFGKAFHLKSMIQCFIVSNITYYILNRITTPLGISILIPIMLRVGLSYVTSKLVKKTYKPLYRGMTKEMFEETILQIVDKDSLKYKICYDFYINKKSDLSLSMKYNYSVMGIRKIKSRINDKIKEL